LPEPGYDLQVSTPDLTVPRTGRLPGFRAGFVALAVYAGLIVVAHLLGTALAASGQRLALGAPPLFGELEPRISIRIVPAVLIAATVVAWGHRAAFRLSWKGLLWASFVGAAVWAVALAAADGWGALTAPMANPLEAFAFLPHAGDLTDFVNSFTSRIAGFPIHVQGHPPGLVVLLGALKAIGLTAPGIVAALYIATGASVVPAVLVAAKSVSGEDLARTAAPWLVLAPFAVWIATSADALYAGVAAWAVALIISADPDRWLKALGGGVLFGCALFLTYGAAALAVVPAAVALARRNLKPLLYAGAGASLVVLLFALFGFWWPEGLMATRVQYYAGIGGLRPYPYFLIANLAALAIACGPAAIRGMIRTEAPFDKGRLLFLSALVAVAAANLSGLSKGEVERIWLLFTPWLVLAAAWIGPQVRRWWLGASAATAIAVQALVMSPW